MSLVAFPLTILSCTSSAKKGESSETPADSTSKEGTANEEKVSFTVKGVTFNMILVKGGTFDMGATAEQGTDAKADEKPVHSVTLSDYYIAETEVTQALYEAVIGSNPADSVGAELPVVLIEWGDADLFASNIRFKMLAASSDGRYFSAVKSESGSIPASRARPITSMDSAMKTAFSGSILLRSCTSVSLT